MPTKKATAKKATAHKAPVRKTSMKVFRCRLGGEHPSALTAERCPGADRCATATTMRVGF